MRAVSVSFSYSKSITDLCVLSCKTKLILCPLAKAEVAIDKCVQYEETWVLYFLTAQIHTLMLKNILECCQNALLIILDTIQHVFKYLICLLHFSMELNLSCY